MDIVLTLKSFFKDSSCTPLVIFEHFHSKIFVKKRTKKILCSKILVENQGEKE